LVPARSGNAVLPTSGTEAASRKGEQSATGGTYRAMDGVDRGEERRRAAALARHYRDQEGLPIAEIARRLGRAQATIKAYLYDPS
jgi:DNA-binding NarL/FixJ family response regulator